MRAEESTIVVRLRNHTQLRSKINNATYVVMLVDRIELSDLKRFSHAHGSSSVKPQK